MNDLQEELTGTWIENEYGSIDGFGCEISLEGLMDGNSVDVGVINEPNDLLGEEFRIILGVEVGFSGLRGVQLQTLSDTFTEHIEGWIGFHDFVHGLQE